VADTLPAPAHDWSAVRMDADDLTPSEHECLRCGTLVSMRFAGICPACRDDLHERVRGEAREIDVAAYEPTMHVTPNAVALKDD